MFPLFSFSEVRRSIRRQGGRWVLASLLIGGFAGAPAQTVPSSAAGTPELWNQQWMQASEGAAPARAAQLQELQHVLTGGPYREDWKSLQQHQVPDWYQDAKFGIFIHWGVYSVPAFGSEWYSRLMYQQGTPEFKHHLATFGSQAKFGYKDFIPMFRMQRFDPEAWAQLFQQSGARYIVPVAEHHDGFALYPTALSPWNAVAMGPHRDLVGDLRAAVLAHNMHFGVSYHRAEHDWFFDGGRQFPSDVGDPRYAGFYGPAEPRELESTDDTSLNRDYTFVSSEFRADWLARTTELVERYQPELLYFDWWVGQPDFRGTEERFATFFYNFAAQHQKAVVMFSKYDDMAEGSGVRDLERGAVAGIQALPWQTDTSISNASWGYVEGDTYKTPQVLLDQLADIVSKNGNLLLNIGPRADGTIPDEVQSILLSIGRWLGTNGEAIYGSRPWTQFGEGPTGVKTGTFQDKVAPVYTPQDFRFTAREGLVYAIEMRAPPNREAVITALLAGKGHVSEVALLGSREKLVWTQERDGLHIHLPSDRTGEYAPVFRIRVK